MKKIVIFGESHTRSFAYIQNVIPVFMGSGKTINLDNKNINNVKNKIKLLKDKLPTDDYVFFTFLGEPNVRYQLNYNWDIHRDIKFKHDGNVNTKYLDNCINNYKKLLDELNIGCYVITPTTAYEPSKKSLIYFNNKLSEVFQDKVIDIFSHTLDGEKIRDEFKDPDFVDDPIHLNSNIVDCFFKELLTKKILTSEEIPTFKKSKELVYANHMKNIFNKNRFGTFNLK